MVRDMVDVTIRGTAEAVDLFLKTFARYQPEGAADEWCVYLKSWSPESLKHPELEFLEEARVRILQSLLIRRRQLPHEFQPGSLFTNRFVPDIPAKPAPFLVQGGGVGFLLVGNVVGAAGFSAPLRLSRKNQRGFGWKRARFPGSFPCTPSGSHHLPRGPARVSRKTLSLT